VRHGDRGRIRHGLLHMRPEEAERRARRRVGRRRCLRLAAALLVAVCALSFALVATSDAVGSRPDPGAAAHPGASDHFLRPLRH
jgi:ferric-dicitrate binding protein FerR (iron transport regulator)